MQARLFNPYKHAERLHPGTAREVGVGCSLGHCFSLLARLPYACAEWTSGKNDSRILGIDTVESAAWPGRSRQFLSFLICGFGHSDSRGTQ